MLLYKLVYGHEAATDTQNQIVVFQLHDHLLGEIAILPWLCAVFISHEQALHPLLRITLIDEIC